MIHIKNTRYLQYVAGLSATIITISITTMISWSSPALPILSSEESPLGDPLNDEEASWIVSAPLLVSLPFAFTGGWLLDKFGRKKVLLGAALPLGIPWIIIIFAKSFLMLCIARSILGLGYIIVIIGCPMYNSEIADNDIRGKLGLFMIALSNMGSLLMLGIGPFVSYTTLAILCLCAPVLFLCIFSFMPESPFYLVKAGRIEEARDVLVKIAPNNREKGFFDDKIEEIHMSIEKQKEQKSTFSELFTTPEYRKALLVIMGLKTLQEFSGKVAIAPYLQTIVEASNTDIAPEISSVIFGVISLPTVILAALFVDKLGRKPLLIISASACSLSLMAEGVFFYLKDEANADVSQIFWLPTTALVIFLSMSSFGIMTLPYVILGEIFATNIKGIAMSVATFYGTILAFALSKLFQPMANKFGIYSMFWFFGTSCLVGCFFVYFCVPETKGKTFADIQKRLRNEDQSDGIKA